VTLKGFGIVHRDIKGENIFIKDKQVKLGYIIYIAYNFSNLIYIGDFGLARERPCTSDETMTIVGTEFI
jgi:serine/threonine protein kinase